jgi:hypothetical protein
VSWTAAQRRQKRREYDRLYRSGETATGRNPRIVVPTDVTVLDRDPSPCFRCGEREGCRHRRAFAW